MADTRHRRRAASGKDAGLKTEIAELWELILTYAKQQTLEPLKALGRFVAFGVAGALLIGIGCLLLAVGTLRAVQAEAGRHLGGDLSWVPYVLALVFCAVVAVLMVRLISRAPSSEER